MATQRRYTIELKKSVLKDIRRIPDAVLNRILSAIGDLGENPLPSGCESIRGYDNTWRIRVGHYRIVYHIAKRERVITIIVVRHRKDAYRSL